MAAKFIVFALAVASASAGCLSSFQQDEFSFGQCGESQAMTVEAPRMEFLQSGPTFELSAGQSASTGPQVSSRALPVVQAAPVTLNAVESPIIRLPSPPVPEPRVVRHQCYCTKTIVRPQVIQRTVTVPRVQRYLKQSYKPIVENVSYQARPVGNDFRGEDIVISGNTGSSSGSQELSFPVRAQEVIRVPVSFSQEGECSQCEQSFPRCF